MPLLVCFSRAALGVSRLADCAKECECGGGWQGCVCVCVGGGGGGGPGGSGGGMIVD